MLDGVGCVQSCWGLSVGVDECEMKSSMGMKENDCTKARETSIGYQYVGRDRNNFGKEGRPATRKREGVPSFLTVLEVATFSPDGGRYVQSMESMLQGYHTQALERCYTLFYYYLFICRRVDQSSSISSPPTATTLSRRGGGQM